MLLSSPPFSQKVLDTLNKLDLKTVEQLTQLGAISAFLHLKESGLTITRSTLWQLYAITEQQHLSDITDEKKKQLLSQLKAHPPIAIFPETTTLNNYMTQALLEAKKAYNIEEIPIGCIIVYRNQIIGRGYNQSRLKNLISAHAELIAIQEASSFIKNFRLENCDLYTTVEPCPMCASAIIQARIRRVIIGTMEPRTGAAGSVIDLFGSRNINQHTAVYKGVLQKQCQNILHDFFRAKRHQITQI